MKTDKDISKEVVKRLKDRHGVELMEELLSVDLNDEIPFIVRDVLELTR